MHEVQAMDVARNLSQLRNALGLSQEELADRAGISRAGYRKIEAGASQPRPATVLALAAALDVKAGEILRPSRPLPVARFRSTKRLRERQLLLMRVGALLEQYHDLEVLLNERSTTSIPVIGIDSPDRIQRAAMAASQVRAAYRLASDEPIHDICGLLEDHGVKVLRMPVQSDAFFGLSVADGESGPAIVVNVWDRISVERWIFTAAHELGHLVLHREDFDPDVAAEIPEHEREADAFAAHFLMPEESFAKEWQQSRGLGLYERVLKLKRIYRVSYATVLYRLSESGMPNAWARFKAEARRQSGQPLRKTDEPAGLPRDAFLTPPVEINKGSEPTQLDAYDFLADRRQRLVREAVEAEMISMGRAAEILGIPLRAMRELAGSWA